MKSIISVVKAVIVLAALIHPSITLYHEQIDSKQLDQLFDDDDCIEGTLASIEAVWPTFKHLTIIGGTVISSEQNELQNKSVISEEREKNSSGKSPLSLVTELAQFNRVKVHYNVIDEKGPAHNKRFIVKLKLGEEEYDAEGSSIKQAQREAARLALNSTSFEHPPFHPKQTKSNIKTSVEKLSDWVYTRIEFVKMRYYYFEESKYVPNLNDYFHSKPKSVFRVTVKINEKEYSGEGLSLFTAKENAASLAWNNLKNLDGLCPFNNDEGGVLAKIFGYDLDSESPVSLINEFGLKSNIKTSFILFSEEGPAHMKHFVYKCSVGDHETFGDGSSKKEAHREAAKKMVHILKALAFQSAENCSKVFKKKRKSKRKKSKNLTKSFKPKPSYLEEDDSETTISNNIPVNPISKLYQIQQQIHGEEPVFKVIKETDGVNKEFSIQVFIGELSCIGSGQNKKSAKRKAAEEMLKKLGYSNNQDKQRSTVSENKKKEFVNAHSFNLLSKKPLKSDTNLGSNMKFSKVEKEEPSSGNINMPKEHMKVGKNSDYTKIPKSTNKLPKTSKTSLEPIQDLKSLAKHLGIKFEFYDFPKEKKMGFVSLLSITTNPPKVCKGSGETVTHSQEKAALSALENLYKTQLETISNVLEKTGDLKKDIKEEIEETVVELLVNIEKE